MNMYTLIMVGLVILRHEYVVDFNAKTFLNYSWTPRHILHSRALAVAGRFLFAGINEPERRRRREANTFTTRVNFFAWLLEVYNILQYLQFTVLKKSQELRMLS